MWKSADCAGGRGKSAIPTQTGPYYQSCRNYLRRHFQARPSSSKHRACEEIGLARDTANYKNCVQEPQQLDVSNDHL